jgi:hypothetical protein
MIWIGLSLMDPSHSDRKKYLGFAMIFANNPFARIFNAAIGKGDEVSGINRIGAIYPLARCNPNSCS